MIQSVTVPPNGIYKAGDDLNFTVSFNGNVTVTGTPELALTVGSLSRTAIYISGSGSSDLVFSYTVQSGDNDGIAVNGLGLNGGAIRDSEANDALLTLYGVGTTTNITVDTIIPTMESSILSINNAYIDITFSEGIYGANDGVTALTADKLALTFMQNSGTATDVTISSIKKNDNADEALATALIGGETTVRVFLNIAGTPNGSETIEIKPANASSIYDKAGNAALITQTTGTKALNDKLAPTFNPSTGVALDETYKILTLTFGENVVNALGDLDALKNAITFAADGTNYSALGESDTVEVVDGKLVISFANILEGSTNKVRIAENSLKDEKGNVISDLIIANIIGANREQGAPTETLIGVAPTVYGASDGKITGTTTAMEYKLSTDTTWTPVTGTEITGLAAGTYNVRYAEKTGFNAGAAVDVVVADGLSTVPASPTGVSAIAGNGSATITFTAPIDNGGSPIISYTVTANPGNITATGSGSPITITGLTNGVAYTFTVTATNAIGTGLPSLVSNSVTPTAPYIPPSGGGSQGGTNTEPKQEQVTVGVTDGRTSNTISQTQIQRTTEADGTKKDEVKYTQDKAQETVDKLKEMGEDTARIVIPDKKDEVSEAQIKIPRTTISVIGQGNINLEIDTENARISIPNESMENLDEDLEEDLFFRVVPIKEEDKKQEVLKRAKEEDIVKQLAKDSDISVLGRPVTIETNMSQRSVDIVLPLKNVTIPENPKERKEFFSKIGVFIEHSDGEKVLTKGEIVEYKAGVLGIKFRINKFSTFTIIKLNEGEFDGSDNISSNSGYGGPKTFMPDKEITITFNKDLDKKSLTKESIYIEDSKGGKVETALKYNPVEKTVTVTPSKYYNLGETYYLYITDKLLSTDGKTIKVSPKNTYEKGKVYYLVVDGFISPEGIELEKKKWIKYTIDK